MVFSIESIAAAEPVRVFWIEKTEMNERDITIVFMLPTKKRNCSGEESSEDLDSWEEISAACPEPKPGRNEAIGAMMDAGMIDFKI